MSHPLPFDFIVDKENNSILIQRDFPAPLSLVWDAYTKAELLDQWWAPKPWKARTKTMDFREGGHWHYAMVGPVGEEHWGWVDYITIKHLQQYTGLDAFTDADGVVNRALPQARWEVSFRADADNTTVVYLVNYPDLAQLEMVMSMGMKEGITMAMEGLDQLLKELQ